MASTTHFTADVVPQAPEDALFGLMAAYRRDTSPDKIDLGIGAYRDNNAKPWVLPVVKKVCIAQLRRSMTQVEANQMFAGRRHSTQRP